MQWLFLRKPVTKTEIIETLIEFLTNQEINTEKTESESQAPATEDWSPEQWTDSDRAMLPDLLKEIETEKDLNPATERLPNDSR